VHCRDTVWRMQVVAVELVVVFVVILRLQLFRSCYFGLMNVVRTWKFQDQYYRHRRFDVDYSYLKQLQYSIDESALIEDNLHRVRLDVELHEKYVENHR